MAEFEFSPRIKSHEKLRENFFSTWNRDGKSKKKFCFHFFMHNCIEIVNSLFLNTVLPTLNTATKKLMSVNYDEVMIFWTFLLAFLVYTHVESWFNCFFNCHIYYNLLGGFGEVLEVLVVFLFCGALFGQVYRH